MAARIDQADPLLSAAQVSHAVVVRAWARDALRVELRHDDPIPVPVRAAFRRVQVGLWDGQHLPVAGLVDDPDSPLEPSELPA